VVAVLVTHLPGEGFEEVLAGLASQDYPNLRVLVLDTGATPDVAASVGRHLPGAFIRPLGANPGFGAAVNEALRLVEGAGFFCVLHDDVALDPPAIRLLVEEVFRSNAGLAGPKLVEWDRPGILQAVGVGVDKLGERAPISERGELDQEQHDAVRDVFCIPTACLLVRTDLFRALDGFDPDVFEGDDLDLCWRAHVSGARVLVVPAARARHRGAIGDRGATDAPDRNRTEALAERQRLLTVLTCYRPMSLLRVLPQYAIASLIQAVLALLTGRLRRAQALVGAWFANLARPGTIHRRRRALAAVRQVRDAEVRELQVRGFARLRAFLRGHGAQEERIDAVSGAGRSLLESVRHGSGRGVLVAWTVIVAAFLIGSRELIMHGIPAVGGLLPFPASVFDLWRHYQSSWWPTGLGAEQAAPTGIALTGILGFLVVGAMGLARTLAILAPVVLGYVGAWRLAQPLGRARAAIGALVVYAAVPLPYNALATGRWSGVITYGAVPWVLLRVARMTGLEPFARSGDASSDAAGVMQPVWLRSWFRDVLGLALLLAVAGAFAPLVVLIAPALALVLALGSLLVGGAERTVRAIAGAFAAAAIAVVLHLPWSLGVLGDGWVAIAGVPLAGGDDRGLDQLARFATGPFGAGALVLGWWVVAAVALVITDGWRFAWAVRAATVAVVFEAVALAADRGIVPFALGPVETLLAPAAAALALLVGCGAVGAELDVRGRRLGWRQPLTLAATVLLFVAALPAVTATADGRWKLGTTDLSTPLTYLPTQRTPGAYRILWAGDPRVLPAPGWRLTDGVGYGLSDDGAPTLLNHWTDDALAPEQELGASLRLATTGATDRLGHLLAPSGVRYVVVPNRTRPASSPDGESHPPPPELLAALGAQLDLRSIDVDDALSVYENMAWIPVRAALSAEASAASVSGDPAAVATASLGTSAGVLLDVPSFDEFTGPVPGGDVYLAAQGAGRWRVEVDGKHIEARPAFGWAHAFAAPAGQAHLRHDTPPVRLLFVMVQLALWLAVIFLLGREAAAPGRARRLDERRARAAAAELAAQPAPVLIELEAPHAEDLPWVQVEELTPAIDEVGLDLHWADDAAPADRAAPDEHSGAPVEVPVEAPVRAPEGAPQGDDEP